MTEIFDDIRKLYLFRKPGPGLSQYIEFFSETSLEATSQHIRTDTFSVKLFPSFTPTIWLNMGDSSYELLNEGKITRVGKSSNILVLRSTTLERMNLATDNIFTIKFLPLGFEAIFGISQATIGNGIVNADEILGMSVIKKIKELGSLNERSLFLEKIFLEKLQKNSQDKFCLELIEKSILLFSQSSMESRLKDLASKLNISEKTFYRYFQTIIGTNPKDFFLVTRCREALSLYKKSRNTFSPYDFGYYDFAHFSKEVKRFTGSSLTCQNGAG